MFSVIKKNALGRVDKSVKGSFDKLLIPLINLINKNDNVFTTSSCSGRSLLLYRYGTKKKNETEWLFKTHSNPSQKDFLKTLEGVKRKGEVWLCFDPFILHIRCENLKVTDDILKVARKVGLKHSGIISLGNTYMLEIVGSDGFSSLVYKEKLLVDENYIKTIVNIAKEKFKKNKEKIEKFYSGLKLLFN
jgi:tRNA wybutosine-synthesizing protein 3